jgi:hypothetical protein
VFNSRILPYRETSCGEYPPNTIVAVLYTGSSSATLLAPPAGRRQYDGRNRIPVAGASQQQELFEKVLTHELTHAIVAGIAPSGVPVVAQRQGLAQ